MIEQDAVEEGGVGSEERVKRERRGRAKRESEEGERRGRAKRESEEGERRGRAKREGEEGGRRESEESEQRERTKRDLFILYYLGVGYSTKFIKLQKTSTEHQRSILQARLCSSSSKQPWR